MPKTPEPPMRGPRRSPKETDVSDAAEAGGPAPFDLSKVRQLLEMMEAHGVSEISLRSGHEQIRLRRGGHAVAVAAPVMAAAAPPPAAPVAAPAAGAASAPAAAPADNLLVIKSPTVGTFYAAQSPEDPPFVSVGTKVTTATTVCLIEAMKVFNPIAAEVSGTIEAVLVKNGDAVEFGQALFKVRP
jgi:acetyl-CoA carboxylase biotin carboxyl carrier protein